MRSYRKGTVIVAMIAMRMMQPAVDQIINVDDCAITPKARFEFHLFIPPGMGSINRRAALGIARGGGDISQHIRQD